jgi:hypothetical protein
MKESLEVIANVMLFLSSLLLLIDVAPRDFLPQHKKRIRAIEVLRDKKNILGTIPQGINISPEQSSLSIVKDENTYNVLAAFIRQRSALARGVDWSRAIAIGYSVTSIPVANATLEGFHPLYIALIPPTGQTQLSLYPIGQIGDLDTWLAEQRQGSITKLALVILVVGFFLQLVAPLVGAK